jgi:NTE family protein
MTIGLALGGGGALGVAHLALLEQLDKENIRIDEVAGASAGAIIGLLYASGGSGKVVRFLESAKSRIFTGKNILASITPRVLFARLEETLREHVPEKRFEDLGIRLSVIATQIIDGKMTVLSSGDPVRAVLASAAFPGVFPVQIIKGEPYVDGGVTRNLPADVLRSHGHQFVLASSLTGLDKPARISFSRPKVSARSIEIAFSEFERWQARDADFVFRPKLTRTYWYRLDKLDVILREARTGATQAVADLKRAIASSLTI